MHFLFSKKCLFFSDAHTLCIIYIIYETNTEQIYNNIQFGDCSINYIIKFNHLVERQIALMRFALLLHVA